MKVAIVGSGISGLTAGWLLHRAGHEVTLLERQPEAGLHAHSVDIGEGNTGSARCFRDDDNPHADVPLRMFNRSLWPTLFRLYETIGVKIETVDPSKTFAEFGGETKLKLGESWVTQPMRFLWQRDARRIKRDIRKLMMEAPIDVIDPQVAQLEFFSYLTKQNYSDTFIYKFLFPSLASTVCTCSYESLKRFPAGIMLKAMLLLTNREVLCRVRGGAADVARRLTSRLANVHFDAAVHSAVPTATGVRINLESGAVVDVDQLIVATQANSAARILPASSTKVEAMLKCFTYEDIEVVLHRDENLMPVRKSDWSNFNLMFENTNQSAMCTVWMNRFYPHWKTAASVFQTISPFAEAASDKVICRRRLQRPVVNRASLHGLKLLAELQHERDRRIWFCGSYASPGVPLLESGVVSALAVVKAMQVALPDSLQVRELVS